MPRRQFTSEVQPKPGQQAAASPTGSRTFGFKSGTVWSTGQIAAMAKCAARTVSKWIDSGKLHGYRIPHSKDRRVTSEDLIAFFRDNGIPIPDCLMASREWRVLLVGWCRHEVDSLVDRPDELKIVEADSIWQAGIESATAHIDVVSVSTSLPSDEVYHLGKHFHKIKVGTVLLVGEDGLFPDRLREVYSRVFMRPFVSEEISQVLFSRDRTRKVKTQTYSPNRSQPRVPPFRVFKGRSIPELARDEVG